MKMDYEYSVSLAKALGFTRVEDEKAYRKECFVKEGKIWIHWIERLKDRLSVVEDEELRPLGYDLDSYRKYKKFTNIMVLEEIERLKGLVNSSNSVFYSKNSLLDDSILSDLLTLKDEGFDDEILADFHHQRSKR